MSFNINKFKERALTLDSIALLYILIVGGLCHILPIPEIVKGFLALPALLIFYYLFGKCVLDGTSKTLNNYIFWLKLKKSDLISQFIFFWLFGYFIVTFLLYLLNTISTLLVYEFKIFFIQDNILKYIFLYFFLFILFYKILKHLGYGYSNENRYDDLLKNISNEGINSKTLLFFILFSMTMVSFSKMFIPFPYIGELYISVAEDECSSSRLLNDGYLALGTRYVILQFNSIGHVFFGIEILTLNWVVPYLLFFILMFGIYMLSYSISKNKFISLFGSVSGSLFAATIIDIPGVALVKGNMLYVVLLPLILFFINRNFCFTKTDTLKKDLHSLIIIGCVFVLISFFSLIYVPPIFELSTYQILLKYLFLLTLILILVLFGTFYKKEVMFTFLIILFICFTFHSQEFILFFGIIFLYLFGLIIIKSNSPYGHYFIIFMIFLSLLFFSVQYFSIINFTDAQYFTKEIYSNMGMDSYNFTYKLNRIEEKSNSIIWLFAIIASIFILIYGQKKYMQKNILIIFMSYSIVLVYFLPESATIRIEKFMCPFIGFLVGWGIFHISKFFNQKYIYFFAIFFIICMLFATSFSLVYEFAKPPMGYTYYPKFAYYEYESCSWMRTNIPENTILVTDRFSYFTMAPLSQKIYFMNLDMNKDMGTTQKYDINKWMMINEIFHAENSEYAYNNLKKLEKMHIVDDISKAYVTMKTIKDPQFEHFSSVIVITGRTIKAFDNTKKTKNQYILPIEWYYSLNKINPESRYLKIFNDQKYFTLLYNNSDYIYIFGVNSEPGIPVKIQNNSR
ncbi:MAG: hypothetical protein BWK75_02050 [Candidatus Altiarchaeales archaeon A3]|nr:MAG: hypothetical protein BWK75_02050 [Candidatus Altiarchaeales archaeon A3]